MRRAATRPDEAGALCRRLPADLRAARRDADRMATALAERLAKFGLRLHEDKTRLIEFGRFAAANRRRQSEGRPETFYDFLGFTALLRKRYLGWKPFAWSTAKTQRGRLVRKLKELRQELKRRMHTPLREQHGWLARVLRGHYAYYGVTGNPAMACAVSGDPDVRALAWSDMAARAKAPNVMGTSFQRSSARQPTAAAESSFTSGEAERLETDPLLIKQTEPDAGKLQVRICGEGGGATAASTRPLRIPPTSRAALGFNINV